MIFAQFVKPVPEKQYDNWTPALDQQARGSYDRYRATKISQDVVIPAWNDLAETVRDVWRARTYRNV